MSEPITATDDSLDIAIVGMAGRFPGAPTIGAFWQNLCNGVEARTVWRDEELVAAGIPPALVQAPNYVKVGMVLDDIECFDAPLFGYSPREAESLDPQQRLFLECAWAALEDTGYDPGRYSGLIGVFAGVSLNTYLLANVFGGQQGAAGADLFQAIMGGDKDFISTRVSYKLGLRGPSLTVQTACSTSLVAVHLACQSLLTYQSDMALAGGASVSVPRPQGYLYQPGGIFSPDGHCRAFDDDAQGTLKGNGVGVVVLKRLTDALADGDHIYALIKGSAVNNDGALKIGYTAPSQQGQSEVLAAAYAAASVAPETVGMIEAHGTGTPLGDPIEVAALTAVFQQATDARNYCALGSVKTNIGHLDAAAGVTGLIKAALALYHRRIPPSLHCQRVNRQLGLDASPFYIARELREWADGPTPRRAGVSAFGIGGTNAHVVLEEPPAPPPASPAAPAWQLLALSARTAAALDAATDQLAAHLAHQPQLCLANIAYTTQVGRQALGQRRVAVCATLADARDALATRDARQVFAGEAKAALAVAFMFPGGGAQYASMGAALYQDAPVFRSTVDRCAEILGPLLNGDLRAALYGPDVSAATMERTAVALPALFVTEYALACQLMAWGIQPTAMIGHSLGEYVAACLAGVFSLDDALALVALRGRLFEELPSGAMLSVALGEDEIQLVLGSELSLAAVNGPANCVIAGTSAAIDATEQALQARGVKVRRLAIAVAAHSALVEPILPRFAAFVRTIALQPPARPYVSNVTGTWATDADATNPDYWVRHLRETVRWNSGIATLLNEPDYAFVEVGPGQTLTSLTRLQPAASAQIILQSMRHPQQAQPDTAMLLGALGRLWVAGATVDWPALHRPALRQRVPLPTYPFERLRYWIEPTAPGAPPAPTLATPLPCTTPHWNATPRTPRAIAKADVPWLIFCDRHGVGQQLAAQHTAAGGHAVEVWAGSTFRQLSNHRYCINPADPEQYHRLLRALVERGLQPSATIYLWALGAKRASAWALFAAASDATASLRALSEALRLHSDAPPNLIVASCGLHSVVGDVLGVPQRAALLGICDALPKGYPGVLSHVIDLERHPITPALRQRAAQQLRAEALALPGTVAYRGNQRWVRVMRPADAPPASGIAPRGSVAVIIDGVDGSGLAAATWLASNAAVRLVLIEPPAFPPPDAWPAWLDNHADDPTSSRIRALQSLAADGVPLMVLCADATERRQLRAALQQVQNQWEAPYALVHAGVADQLRQRATAASPLDNLVAALDALHEALLPVSVARCVLFSASPPGLDPLDAGAAQSVIQAVVQRYNTRGSTHWSSVAWEGKFECSAAHALAGDAFGLVLAQGLTGDAMFLHVEGIPLAVEVLEERASGIPIATPITNHYPRPALQTPFVAPQPGVEHQLAELWTQVLGVAPIGAHDNFFELRGDSLLSLQLVARINEALGVAIPMSGVFERPTVAELATAIVAQQGGGRSSPWSALVRLQPTGSRRPFFCVHPAGGTGTCYADVARLLGSEQPFYALQALGIDGDCAARTDITSMAASYLAEIRTVQPHGPYRLGGWSMGGTIAYEMAQQLAAAGEQVERLVLIDTPALPAGLPPHALDDATLASSMLDMSTLTQPDAGQPTGGLSLDEVFQRAKTAGLFPADLSTQRFVAIVAMFRAHAEAWWQYRPQPYTGALAVFRADQSLGGAAQGAALGWDALTTAVVYSVPGNHQTLIAPPHVQALAAQLDAYLRSGLPALGSSIEASGGVLAPLDQRPEMRIEIQEPR